MVEASGSEFSNKSELSGQKVSYARTMNKIEILNKIKGGALRTITNDVIVLSVSLKGPLVQSFRRCPWTVLTGVYCMRTKILCVASVGYFFLFVLTPLTSGKPQKNLG